MTLLKKIDDMRELETKKQALEYTLKQMGSTYHKQTEIEIGHTTSEYSHDGYARTIKVNDKLFKQYLKEEIVELDVKIDDILTDMVRMKEGN